MKKEISTKFVIEIPIPLQNDWAHFSTKKIDLAEGQTKHYYSLIK